MTFRYHQSMPNILSVPMRRTRSVIKFTDPHDPTEGFRTLANYAQKLYQDNEISKDIYISFLAYIAPLCLRKIIENKIDEITPMWNKRFSRWLRFDSEI
jgi:hypothetical protein